MTDRDRRRADRDAMREHPPEAGVYLLRHRATGRTVVATAVNLQAARNRFDFCVATGTLGAFDPGIVADARAHGTGGLELEVVETVVVEPGSAQPELAEELEVLAALWRERLAAG